MSETGRRQEDSEISLLRELVAAFNDLSHPQVTTHASDRLLKAIADAEKLLARRSARPLSSEWMEKHGGSMDPVITETNPDEMPMGVLIGVVSLLLSPSGRAHYSDEVAYDARVNACADAIDRRLGRP